MYRTIPQSAYGMSTCREVSVAWCCMWVLLCCSPSSDWDWVNSWRAFSSSASFSFEALSSWNKISHAIHHTWYSVRVSKLGSSKLQFLDLERKGKCVDALFFFHSFRSQYHERVMWIAGKHSSTTWLQNPSVWKWTWWREEMVWAECSREPSASWYSARLDWAFSRSEVTDFSSLWRPLTSVSSCETEASFSCSNWALCDDSASREALYYITTH